MHTKLNDQIRKVLFRFMLGGIALFLSLGASGSPVAHLQEAWALDPGPYYTVTEVTLSDGNIIEEVIINGPPVPPPGFEVERQAVSLPEADSAAGIKTLTVPAFNWVFGCSAVSGAMIAGYYDRSGWSNIYTGPTNGGVMPLNNSSWPTWSDGIDTYPNCPLIASKNTVDGRATRGSIDDYWIEYGSTASDPYITGVWTQHTWGDAIGDYMMTSQSAYGNTDGSTRFYNYTSSASQLTCATMASNGLPDGTLGRKHFYEARGYTVTDCYNQKTDNNVSGGFSFAQFKAEIDANRPVMLNLEGHTIVGVGYDDSSNLVYIHDTWDYSNHTMTWGTSYAGMALRSVSIVNLQSVPQSASDKIGVFRNGTWSLDYNGNGIWDGTVTDGIISFGLPGDIPVVGNWNPGTGFSEKIGVFRPASGRWYLDWNGNDVWNGSVTDKLYTYGGFPVVGDWNGNGSTKIAGFQNFNGQGAWYLDYNGNGTWDFTPGGDWSFVFGLGTDYPVAGDWSGTNSYVCPGVFRSVNGQGRWYLDWNCNKVWEGSTVDRVYTFGLAGDIPVVGDWNGDGRTKIGVFRGVNGLGKFYLDYNGNGIWEGCSIDRCYTFGAAGDWPVAGKW